MRPLLIVMVCGGLSVAGCKQQAQAPAAAATAPAATATAKPAERVDNTPPLHPDNIVSIASRSKDHTTLIAAVKAADYVTSVAASGPLTVFAPTNDAFGKLPAGTVENLVKPENADKLREILKYHVTTSALQREWLKDGQTIGMANGAKTTIKVEGDKISINGATIVASIPASNGMIHVIDGVLLPPAK